MEIRQMAKKSDYAVVTDALANVRTYNVTLATGAKMLKIAEEAKDESSIVFCKASMKMALENRDSAVGTIFRRAAEHVGGDEKSLAAFITKVFAPALVEAKSEVK